MTVTTTPTKTKSKYLAEAEEAARTKTKKMGICDFCKKEFVEVDERGRRYGMCKKCGARIKRDLSGLRGVGFTVNVGPSSLAEQRRIYGSGEKKK